MAEAHGPVPPLDGGFRMDQDGGLNFVPLLGAITELRDPGQAASLFHATLAEGLAHWVLEHSRRQGLQRVAVGGGCFLNQLLSSALRERLQGAGLEVFEAAQVPPNDGGLSLGQAWVAMNSRVADRESPNDED